MTTTPIHFIQTLTNLPLEKRAEILRQAHALVFTTMIESAATHAAKHDTSGAQHDSRECMMNMEVAERLGHTLPMLYALAKYQGASDLVAELVKSGDDSDSKAVRLELEHAQSLAFEDISQRRPELAQLAGEMIYPAELANTGTEN